MRFPHLLIAVASLAAGLAAVPARAQESKLGAAVRLEGDSIAESCNGFDFKKLISCGTTFLTDQPFHVAVGSMAPQNGMGFGAAFVPPQIKPSENWRINWSADAVGSTSSAWRAGAYATFVDTHVGDITVVGAGGGTASADALPRPYPTISVFGQVTSLPKLSYYGLGNDTARADLALFKMRQSTVGTKVVWPIGSGAFFNHLNLSALGELNGRWLDVGGSTAGPEPPIDALYTDATAPGLANQPATVQFGEGLRIAPAIGRLQLIYSGVFQQFVAPSDSTASFRRWTADLDHQFSISRNRQQPATREFNGPNECAMSADRTVGSGCPDPTLVTTDRVGSLGFRALFSGSDVSNGSQVPFYFQRTLGGSDIDGERLLASYDDYRFRAPNLFLLQETFEYAIWGPIGAFAEAEQGRVSMIGDSLTKGDLKNTYGLGLTVRAGGLPLISFWWAQGGPEGHHIALTMNANLLGGSARPSLH